MSLLSVTMPLGTVVVMVSVVSIVELTSSLVVDMVVVVVLVVGGKLFPEARPTSYP
jgi:hypothetical protein